MMSETKKKKQIKSDLALSKARDDAEDIARKLDDQRMLESEEPYRTNPPKFGVLVNEPELDIGKRLQQAREDKGLTQGQLSELTVRADKDGKGISRAVISLYESGKNRPGLKEIRLLCENLRVTPSYLIYGDDDPFDGFPEYARFFGMGTEAEQYANLVYLFTRMHGHHKKALMTIMQDMLRLWDRGFDSQMKKEAFPQFFEMADQLRKELAVKGEEPIK